MSEENTMAAQENKVVTYIANRDIPYALISEELDGKYNAFSEEIQEIKNYYKIYREGADFVTEGSNGDYIAASLHYKKASSLIRKEARFLFGEPPTINLKTKDDTSSVTSETKDNITMYQSLINDILKANEYEADLIKAAKDCFIGKRIAIMANFDPVIGVTISFIPSTNFIYEVHPTDSSILLKFVVFSKLNDSLKLKDVRFFKKKYVYDIETKNVYLEEATYDGRGILIKQNMKKSKVKLKSIPAAIVINDGLLGELQGESEIELLKDYESWYSKLSNADKDAERKGMNQIKYTQDMTSNSVKNLSTSPGSYWDLQTNQNLEKPSPKVGTIESNLNYSTALDLTLSRIKAHMHDEVDVPDVSLESMQGVITSGKALKAIYWSLIIRAKEKMTAWRPALESIIKIIIEGLSEYPNVRKIYTDQPMSVSDYIVEIIQNLPIPEDEQEEMTMDLARVNHNTMSIKSFVKKWDDKNDVDADKEIIQIAKEKVMLEQNGISFGNEGEGTGLKSGDIIDDNTDNPEWE